VLYILALPLLISLSFKQKYRQSIPARFFLFKNRPFEVTETLWFHVCSLGEARALKPLFDALKTQKTKAISTITHTGYTEAKRYDAEVRYLPFEIFLPFWIKKQKVLVVLEAEFWYMLFVIAQARGAKVVLLNARISDKSVQNYLRFAWFYKKMLSRVEKVFVQSEVDKNRFLALGARNIEVVGNIKLAAEIHHTQEYQKPACELIVAGSTHADEELLCLEAFYRYKNNTQGVSLIIVPRHPERFAEVEQLMRGYADKYGWSFSKFSEDKTFKTDLILCDMMGELTNLYRVADIAILGGAFRDDIGGHNPLEPAYYGCKIITGEHFFHQKELFKYVHHLQYVAPDAEALCEALEKTQTLPPSMVEEKINLEKVIEYLEKG
jgi:3-deoxy-D-manno-octulosonic-acid transferase